MIINGLTVKNNLNFTNIELVADPSQLFTLNQQISIKKLVKSCKNHQISILNSINPQESSKVQETCSTFQSRKHSIKQNRQHEHNSFKLRSYSNCLQQTATFGVKKPCTRTFPFLITITFNFANFLLWYKVHLPHNIIPYINKKKLRQKKGTKSCEDDDKTAAAVSKWNNAISAVSEGTTYVDDIEEFLLLS